MNIEESLAASRVVPIIQAEDPAVAVRTSRALASGGLLVAEIVLRTNNALECLRAVASEVPEMIAGAGTVLTAAQAAEAVEYGAQFIVSPGLDEGVVSMARSKGVPVYPGTYTPGEVQRALNLGLDTVKFFPASIAGGVPALKALTSVFRAMKFMPTGGVGPENLAEFLAVPSVVACGGSWLTPADAVAKGDFGTIKRRAEEAVSIVRDAGR